MEDTATSTSFYDRLNEAVGRAGSPLCIGLDTEISKMPLEIASAKNPILEFNRRVVHATADLASSYKLNLAFYEADGLRGMDALLGTLEEIPDGVIVVGDAKRGDIGNTARKYADALFVSLGFDAVTVSPYMGTDSLEPFFQDPGRGVFVLALTSNPGSADFQRLTIGGQPLYRIVIDRCLEIFGDTGSLGFVVGATHPNELRDVRRSTGPATPLLVPGIGAQGGEIEPTLQANAGGLALYNVSRGILNAGCNTASIERDIRQAALMYRDAFAVPVGGQ